MSRADYRAADALLAVGTVEDEAFGGEGIDVGRDDPLPVVGEAELVAQVIDDEELQLGWCLISIILT